MAANAGEDAVSEPEQGGSEVAAFLDELRGRDREVATEATDEIIASIPAYQLAEDDLREGVYEVVQKTFIHLIQLWQEDRAATQEEVESLARIGVPPPELGVTLEDTLHAYRIGVNTIWRYLQDLGSSRDLEPSFLLRVAQLGLEHLNDLSSGITRRWMEAERQHSQWREEMEHTLLHALLANPPQVDRATRTARLLGVSLLTSWRALVAEGRDSHGSDAAPALVNQARSALRGAEQQPLVMLYENRCVALVEDGAEALVLDELPEGTVVGVGGPTSGALAIYRSYEDAKGVLEIARRRGVDRLRFEDSWLERFLSGTVSAVDFSRMTLAPLMALPGSKRQNLFATLVAYVEQQGSVTAMARAMYMHPQSVRYRLGRLREIYGEMLEEPRGRLALQIAVETSRLFDLEDEQPGGPPLI